MPSTIYHDLPGCKKGIYSVETRGERETMAADGTKMAPASVQKDLGEWAIMGPFL